jgi:signal recognition particle GTPase
VNQLVRQFDEMRKMMKRMSKLKGRAGARARLGLP